MEDSKRVKEDMPHESHYSDADLNSHLREKVRTQAQRLRNLEQYRLLCEQRIQELFPNHPMPVKQEHLGTTPSTSSDLAMAKQKISRLESQLAQQTMKEPGSTNSNEHSELLEKYNTLVKDKNDLEESLRAEMLNCEEQRTYIEVLKQAIESKVEQVPGSREPQVLVESQKPKGTAEETRRDQAKIKSTLLDYESQIKRLQSQIKTKDAELESLQKERQQLEAHLAQAAEAMQIAEEEVDKLEEEKTNLLEYVDEHSLKEQEMEKELNELSRYFEEMQNAFEKAKKELEEEKKARESFAVQAEVAKEELYRANQAAKELQSAMSVYKNGNEEKESLMRKIKEERLAFEIKAESLQANAATLAETLKETQGELEDVQKELESWKKAENIKSDSVSKLKSEIYSMNLENGSLNETIEELKSELETERKNNLELESLREMDIKQLQEFKAKLSQLKSKCETFEEDKKCRAELEQFRKLDAEKIAQLQEEYNYLQESYRETQQRELIQAEALNGLRKHNSEISRELEELYKESQELSLEINKKSQELDVYTMKYSQANEFCQTIESERKKLELHLKNEKNSSKNFKEQIESNKAKLEELNKQLIETTEFLEKATKKAREKEDEAQGLRHQMKVKEKELEDEKYEKIKLLEELKDSNERLEGKEREMEKIQGEVVECCKAVAGFAGKYTISSHDYRGSISSGYKEFLLVWKDKISSSPKILLSWILSTVEELESLSKSIQDAQKEINSTSLELTRARAKLEGANTEDQSQRQESMKLKAQLEAVSKKHEFYIESTEKELNSLRLELSALKKEIGCLSVENNTLKDSLSRSITENHELKINSEVFKSTLRTHEDRVSLLKTEKNQLESLLNQVQRSIGSSELSKMYNDMSRIRGEVEVLERERLNLECQLLKYQSEPRAKESESFKELNYKLVQCERQIRSFKKNMQILQEDANKEEMVQKLRGNERETLKKNGSHGSSLTQSVGLLHSRCLESPQLRKKSPFS